MFHPSSTLSEFACIHFQIHYQLNMTTPPSTKDVLAQLVGLSITWDDEEAAVQQLRIVRLLQGMDDTAVTALCNSLGYDVTPNAILRDLKTIHKVKLMHDSLDRLGYFADSTFFSTSHC